jgi:acetylornithine deacetylase
MTHPLLPATKAHLAQLIAFDTVSDRSNLALIDHVGRHFAALGAELTELRDTTGIKANLIARLGPPDRAGLVLSGHTDVVPAQAADWTTPPFQMHERNQRLYGRGSVDMKGFLACLMAVAPTMAARELALPLWFCFSHDEEVGCLGAPAIARYLSALPAPPKLAIIGEPSLMQLVTGQKGKIAMRVTVRGVGGHSSFAPRHVNAVEVAARLIGMIADRAARYAAEGPFDPDFTVPHPTMLATMIEGGIATNVTPAACGFTFEIRSLSEPQARADLAAFIAEAEAALLPAMQAVEPTAGIVWEEIFAYPAMTSATQTAGFAAFADRLPGFGGKVSYGSEGGVFETLGGIPSVIVGPGSIEQAHKVDEYIEIAQLDACLHFLDRLVNAR